MVWVHFKTAKPASATTGALVGAGSQQPGTGVQKLFPVHALSTPCCLLIVLTPTAHQRFSGEKGRLLKKSAKALIIGTKVLKCKAVCNKPPIT